MTNPCDSYIVRIYRRGGKNPEDMVGIVEVVETGETKKFASGDELNAVLSGLPKGRKGRRKPGGRDDRKVAFLGKVRLKPAQ
jgi:hypothetical protein